MKTINGLRCNFSFWMYSDIWYAWERKEGCWN